MIKESLRVKSFKKLKLSQARLGEELIRPSREKDHPGSGEAAAEAGLVQITGVVL